MEIHMEQQYARREFLKLAGLSLTGSLATGCRSVPVATNNRPGKHPNVLLISVDDLNNWIEPLGGHPQAKTPNLARFSQQSVTFTNAFCSAPACNPSRTALMTGKAPYLTGVYDNPQIWRQVLPKETTLGQHFQAAGYWTARAGKIYHATMPDPQSWNAHFPTPTNQMPPYYLPHQDKDTDPIAFKKMDNEIREARAERLSFTMPDFKGRYMAFDFEPIPHDTEDTGDYATVDWVRKQLAQKHPQPFLMACGVYRPHLPWYVPRKYFDAFDLDSIQLPKTLPTDLDDLPPEAKKVINGKYHQQVTQAGLWKQAVQGYLASIYYADAMVGELLDALDKSEYADNTIVVIFSDHGWQLGEKQHWRKFGLWQNILNSVLMIKSPESAPGLTEGSTNSTRCEANVSLEDIFPTLTELCGIAKKEGISGTSLVPQLKDPKTKRTLPVISCFGEEHISVIENHWHYILYDGKEEELYHMKNDPEEWTNLASDSQYTAIKQKLKAMIPEHRHPKVPTEDVNWDEIIEGKLPY